MTVSNKCLRIMENILLHNDIRALVWMDKSGEVKARRGSAISLLLDADDPTSNIRVGNPNKKNPESLYICQFDGDGYLVVIFDDDADFDEVKERVDTLIRR